MELSVTGPTLDGASDLFTGKPPVFAHSGFTRSGRRRRALDPAPDPFERGPEALRQLDVVTTGTADDRSEQRGADGEPGQDPPSGERRPGGRGLELVDPGGTALPGLPGHGAAGFPAHDPGGGRPHDGLAPVDADDVRADARPADDERLAQLWAE